jgi:hypothetical protein
MCQAQAILAPGQRLNDDVPRHFVQGLASRSSDLDAVKGNFGAIDREALRPPI